MLWIFAMTLVAMHADGPAERQHRWQPVLRDPTRIVYIDAANAQRTGEAGYRTWVRVEYRRGTARPNRETVSRREYDCAAGRARLLELVVQREQEAPRAPRPGSAEWARVARAESDAAATRAVCRALRMLWPRGTDPDDSSRERALARGSVR